jgi:hypothetical protein
MLVLTITFKKIKDGWTDVDVIITIQLLWVRLGPLGRI